MEYSIKLIALVSVFCIISQGSFAQTNLSTSSQQNHIIELNGSLSLIKLHDQNQFIQPSAPQGFTLELGYRPAFLTPKLFVGLYGFNLPGEDFSSNANPTIRGFGPKFSYSMLAPSNRLNPFLSFGAGFYEADMPPQPVCVTGPCFPDWGYGYKDLTTTSVSPGAGFYLSLYSIFALKADASLFIPLKSNAHGNSDDPKAIYSLGISLQL